MSIRQDLGISDLVPIETSASPIKASDRTLGAREKRLDERQSNGRSCDPIDGSVSGSPVTGILQARTLEWVAISFSNA